MGTEQSKPSTIQEGASWHDGDASVGGGAASVDARSVSSAGTSPRRPGVASSSSSRRPSSSRFRSSASSSSSGGRPSFSSSSSSASSSPLYDLVVSRSWQTALARIATHPKEASTPIKCSLYGIERKVLPLHLIWGYDPPVEVVDALLDADPGGAAVAMTNVVRKKGGGGGGGRRAAAAGGVGGSVTGGGGAGGVGGGGGGGGGASIAASDLGSVRSAPPRSPVECASPGSPPRDQNGAAASGDDVPPSPATAATPPPPFDPTTDGWLPLHLAALYSASPDSIERLLIVHPSGAKCKNGMGMLPLHVVSSGMRPPGREPLSPPPPVRHVGGGKGREEETEEEEQSDLVKTVKLLLRAFPESVHVPASDNRGRTALEYATECLPPPEGKSGGGDREALMELLQGTKALKLPRLPTRRRSSLGMSSEEEGDYDDGNERQRTLMRTMERTRTSVQSFQARDSAQVAAAAHLSGSSRKPFSKLSQSLRRGGVKPKSSSAGGVPLDPTKPTKLYSLVAARDWKGAIQRANKRPAEASVWTLVINAPEGDDDEDGGGGGAGGGVVEGEEGDYACHRLPLHKACSLKPPLELIRALNDAYPESMSAKEKYGMLPLHVACQRHASPDVVRYVLLAYPDAARVPDAFGVLPLHVACTEGAKIEKIRDLLRAYPGGMDVRDKKGNTPLDYARESFHPNRDAMAAALERGVAYWSAVDAKDAPSTYKLAVRGKWDALESRLEEKPSEAGIWVLDRKHDTEAPRLPLHAACARKPPASVASALLEAYPEGARGTERHGTLPLHVACQHNASSDVVEALLDTYREGAAVKDEYELLPIHIACTEGASVEVVEALLRAYPTSGKVRDRKGFNAVHYARASFNPHRDEIVERLKADPSVWEAGPREEEGGGRESDEEEEEDVPSSLADLIDRREWTAAEERIEERPQEASDPGHEGATTPLHRACALRPPSSVVSALIEAHRDGPGTSNERGELPLHVACRSNATVEVVEALAESHPRGASAKDERGRLPLHAACVSGTLPSIVETLLRACPEGIDSKDDDGSTALDHAEASHHPNKTAVIDVLERHAEGRRFGGGAAAGETLYDLVSNRKWVEVVTRCRKRPSEASAWTVDAAFGHGRMAMHLACALRPPRRVVAALHNACPDAVSTTEKHGRYPLHAACQHAATVEVVQLLVNLFPGAVEVRDDFGLLPLHVACAEGASLDVVKVLLRAAPKAADAKDRRGWTPSEYAELVHPDRDAVMDELAEAAAADRRTGFVPSKSVPAKLGVVVVEDGLRRVDLEAFDHRSASQSDPPISARRDLLGAASKAALGISRSARVLNSNETATAEAEAATKWKDLTVGAAAGAAPPPPSSLANGAGSVSLQVGGR